MRKSKFSETQIFTSLHGACAGTTIADLLRKHRISHATYSTLEAKVRRRLARAAAIEVAGEGHRALYAELR
ncbi:MAG: hypothetical protein MUF00_04790 [Gemmatimonadaceae bacterium]|jgi:hypothetical protein|nr:hypothetical protein [Gemmatimonadaceae bacterium]